MQTTVISCLESTKSKYFSKEAIRYKKGSEWLSLTWGEYYEKICTFAKGLIAAGLEEKGFVAILSQNRYEWVVADLGAIAAGAVPTGIYPTSSSEQCSYIIGHCKASVVVVENKAQLEKINAVKAQLPHLKSIVLLDGESEESYVYSWEDILVLGEELPDSVLKERMNAQKPEDLATLVYTSGTTANPKAVMLSHKNLTWTAETLATSPFQFSSEDRTVSYLPLSHIAEQMTTIHGPLVTGACVAFAESLEKLPENLREIRPTIFLGVPRVWEKIQQKMIEKGSSNSGLKKMMAKFARGVALARVDKMERGLERGLLFKFADKIVYQKVRKALGLDNCRLQVTAAAPISKETLEFFLSLNIPLYEIYGMSESSGPATLSYPGQFRIAKAGVVMPGGEVRIAEDGEILIRGNHVFKGYLHDEEETKKILDKDGWLHSGDLGSFDEDGFLSVTGRKKNILITAGGENVAPEMLENKINAIPGVEQAVVIGDQRKYLSTLLTLSTEALSIAANLQSKARTMKDLSDCPIFKTYLDAKIEEVNASLARVQTIKKYSILPEPFTEGRGELTPTMKIKRKTINENYASKINALYA